jgi:hypothetical protein
MTAQYSMWLSSLLVLLLSSTKLLNCHNEVHAQEEAPVCTIANGCDAEVDDDTTNPCRLWLAESTTFKGKLAIYSGVDVATGNTVAEGETLIPIFDINDNEKSLWQDITWTAQMQADLLAQNYYKNHAFISGIGSAISCSKTKENVRARNDLGDIHIDTAGVHRSTHPSAGSFGDRYPLEYAATHDIAAGQELFTHCNNISPKAQRKPSTMHMLKPLPDLQENGICMDGITVQKSTIEGAGRGAFANRAVQEGEIITSSPTLFFDRSQMEIVKQALDKKENLKFTEHVIGHQLLLNYCYGHENSTVLTLPYGPGINFINHGNTPNAMLKWSDSLLSNHRLFEKSATDVLEETDVRLLVEIVSLRDLQPGEEILIDYGKGWARAWEDHVQAWNAPQGSSYISAADYKRAHPDNLINTLEEQESDPYPDNIYTACIFKEYNETLRGRGENEYFNAETNEVYWTPLRDGACLRPCEIVSRQIVGEKTYYTVKVDDMTNEFFPQQCALAPERETVLRTPEQVITVVDKEYTADQFLENSFRHEIGVSDDMYPEEWLWIESEPMGDFLNPDLKPGQLKKIKWKDQGRNKRHSWNGGDVVAEHAYVMGLAPEVRSRLLDYCDRMGITEAFRDLTIRGNSLRPATHRYQKFHGSKWYIQRPAGHWKSNMHWISPSNAKSQEDYWQALSAVGFDDVMKDIGAHLGLESIAAYHLSFIGVSHCQKGYIHYDIKESGARVYNVIIPLLLANETGPELDLRDGRDGNEKGLPVGRLRYEYDVASLMGDDAFHATSAADYRLQKQMRMAATVYIADINEENVEAILDEYTQHYPPKGKPEVLMGMAGMHWRRDDPSVRLPKPAEDHVLSDSFKVVETDFAPETQKVRQTLA